jgi:hypothetical protein
MLVTALWFFHLGRRFAEDRHFGITSGENVSNLSESAPAPAVPQWKFIHVLSAKNDSSVLSLSDDGAAREPFTGDPSQPKLIRTEASNCGAAA